MTRSAAVSALITVAFLVLVVAIVLLPAVLALPDPMAAMRTFVLGPFGNLRHFGNIVELATPSMFCGLAVALMFRAGAFNLGVEGAFFLGGLVATVAALVLPVPGWLAMCLAVLAGAVVGSLVCIVPGAIKAATGASELVSSIMLNYVALFVGLSALNFWLRDPSAGALVSYALPAGVRFSPLVHGTRIHFGSVAAVVACLLGAVYLFRTSWGFEARLAGDSAGFAAHLGLRAGRIAIAAQVIGGLIAAGGGAMEILGLYQRFSWNDSPGNGWTGVIVAILARNNPILIIPAALFLSYVQVGGDLLSRNFDVPIENVQLVQALIMLLATSTAIAQHPAVRRLISGKRAGAAVP